MSWAGDVISGGTGLDPGLKEIMRLTDSRDDHQKAIVAVKILIPSDDSAHLRVYQGMTTISCL